MRWTTGQEQGLQPLPRFVPALFQNTSRVGHPRERPPIGRVCQMSVCLFFLDLRHIRLPTFGEKPVASRGLTP